MTDLALAGGRVLDPGRGIDDRLDVGVTAGRIAASTRARCVSTGSMSVTRAPSFS